MRKVTTVMIHCKNSTCIKYYISLYNFNNIFPVEKFKLIRLPLSQYEPG